MTKYHHLFQSFDFRQLQVGTQGKNLLSSFHSSNFGQCYIDPCIQGFCLRYSYKQLHFFHQQQEVHAEYLLVSYVKSAITSHKAIGHNLCRISR